MARNVSTATLTPFLPKPGTANGAAVIVAPGGGFRWLSMGNEGWEVAQALNAKGIAAFVLKYRLQPTPESLDGLKASMERTFAAAAPPSGASGGEPRPAPPRWDLSNQLQDAEAAYAMIVKRAKEWGVDTARLGMIGFSAGAGLTMHSTLNSKTMKLAFIGPIYGGMGPVEVPKDAPPMFTVIATDDFLFRGQFGVIESGSKRAGRSSFTSIRTAATASASATRTAPAIAGSMPSSTGWTLTAFSRRRRASRGAVSGRWCMARHWAGRSSNSRSRYRLIAGDSGLPSAVIRFRTPHARLASPSRPPRLRARGPSPMMDL